MYVIAVAAAGVVVVAVAAVVVVAVVVTMQESVVTYSIQNDDNTTYHDIVGDVCSNSSYPEVADGESVWFS